MNRLTAGWWRLALVVLLVFGVAKPVVRDAKNSNFLAAHLTRPGARRTPAGEIEAYRPTTATQQPGR